MLTAEGEDGGLARFRMDVVCTTVPEAVARAGGLICDRFLTGWDVNVFVWSEDHTPDHDLALRIIGAARRSPADIPKPPTVTNLLRAVVLSGSLYRGDDGLRRWVEEAMSEPPVEVLLWDCDFPGRPSSEVRHVEIPISRAAAAFRDRAVAAADLEPLSTHSELYCQLTTGWIRNAVHRADMHLRTADVGSQR